MSTAPTSELAFPRVAAAIDLRRPLRFQDEFDVLIQVASLEEKRITYACTMTSEDVILATGTMSIDCAALGPPLLANAIPANIARRFSVRHGQAGH